MLSEGDTTDARLGCNQKERDKNESLTRTGINRMGRDSGNVRCQCAESQVVAEGICQAEHHLLHAPWATATNLYMCVALRPEEMGGVEREKRGRDLRW